MWLLLIARVTWEPVAREEGQDRRLVSFRAAPESTAVAGQTSPPNDLNFLAWPWRCKGRRRRAVAGSHGLIRHCVSARPDRLWRDLGQGDGLRLQRDQFALLDVSTNADLLGVSFGTFGTERMAMRTTMLPAGGGFPLQVEGMDVVTRGLNVARFHRSADFVGAGDQSDAARAGRSV